MSAAPAASPTLAWVALGLAALAFAAQVVVGAPVLGTLAFGSIGLVALAVPAIGLVAAVEPGQRGLAERVLAGVAATLALAVLVGIAAGLAPRGLDAGTVGAIELLLTGVVAALRWQRQREGRGSSPSAPTAPPMARRGVRWNRSPRTPGSMAAAGGRRAKGPGSWADRVPWPSVGLAVAGVALAAAGITIAVGAAEAAATPDLVQFWAAPAVAAKPTALGVRNASPASLACVVTVRRPGQAVASVDVGPLAPEAAWTGTLPLAGSTETAPWQLELTCSGGRAPIDRLLLIDPPGNPRLAAPSGSP